MKMLIMLSLLSVSTNGWSMNLTKKLQVSRITLNEAKKNYDVVFEVRSGIYHADESLVPCLQKSLEKKQEVNVEFEAMGLKIVKCSEK